MPKPTIDDYELMANILLQHDERISISESLLNRIVLAANRDDRRITAVYILPARTATDGEDSYMFEYDERTPSATDS